MVETVINQNDGFVSITAVGGETELDFDFPLYEKSHIRIIRTRSGVQSTLVLDTDYTIADDQLEVTAGGTAVLAGAASPAIAADVYTLLLNVPEARVTDFTQAGDFKAATLNRELDLYAQMSQQLRRDVNKSARLPDNSTLTSLTLPSPVSNNLLGWNNAATGLENKVPANINLATVSSFISTLLDDADGPTALATLGALPLAGGTMTGALNQALGADIASASTINLTTATGNVVDVTGTNTINAITLAAGAERIVRFTGALTLTHGASLVLPNNGSNITTAAGDFARFRGYAAGVVRCEAYTRANGSALRGGGKVLQRVRTTFTAGDSGAAVTTPFDDTIPQITEGREYMTQAITPLSTTSVLVVTGIAWAGITTATGTIIWHLHRDSTANAFAAGPQHSIGTDLQTAVPFSGISTSGSLSATTFRLRMGASNGNPVRMNNVGGARILGGVSTSYIEVFEVEV